jgi:hypothetical protein
MDAEGLLMHIDRPDEVAVAGKATLAARPLSSSGLVLVPAHGTPAAGSSFGAGRAHDAGLPGFMGEIVDVAPILPQRHALVMMPAIVPVADTMRVADEERAHPALDAEVDHRPGGLVPQVAHAPLGPPADFVPGVLQLLPAARVLRATALLPGEPAELPAALPLEGADAASGHDERLARAGRDGGQVDFPQVDRRLDGAGSLTRLRDFHADVQFKAVVPHQNARPGIVRQVERQDEGWVTLAHRQHDAPFALVDGLGRPLERVERLGAPGVLHAPLGMFLAECACGLDGTQEGAEDSLHRLAVQGEAPFGHLVQVFLVRPRRVAHSGLLVGLHTDVPDLGRFHLRLLEASEERGRQVVKSVDSYCFHMYVFFLSARKAEKPGGIALIPPPGTGRVFPLPLIICSYKGNSNKGISISSGVSPP